MALKYGTAPYLECSSKGDKRFSAFFARIKSRGNKSIEEIYQASKIFEDGSTGLHWKLAKGRKDVVNREEVNSLYSKLWDEYIEENPELLEVLVSASGLSDIFGRAGSVCQSTELWRIRNSHLERLSIGQHMSTEKPLRECIRIIVYRESDGKILMGERRDKKGNLLLTTFPGGGIEDGETPSDAAKKECLEELGAKIKDVLDLGIGYVALFQADYKNKERAAKYRGQNNKFYSALYAGKSDKLYNTEGDGMVPIFVTFEEALKRLGDNKAYSGYKATVEAIEKVRDIYHSKYKKSAMESFDKPKFVKNLAFSNW
jgi:hypothetical protein